VRPQPLPFHSLEILNLYFRPESTKEEAEV
jgi:hypothetical protein